MSDYRYTCCEHCACDEDEKDFCCTHHVMPCPHGCDDEDEVTP